MRITRVVFLLVGLALASAASAVSVDHDAKTDFSKFHTYSWLPGTAAQNPLMEQRIHDAIDAQLAAKGLKKVESGGDVMVSTHASSQTEQRVNVSDYGYAGPYWGAYNRGYTSTSVTYYTVKVGTLVVDMVDGSTNKAVWRGEASALVGEKPEKNTEKLNKVVTKLFKNFPPQR